MYAHQYGPMDMVGYTLTEQVGFHSSIYKLISQESDGQILIWLYSPWTLLFTIQTFTLQRTYIIF